VEEEGAVGDVQQLSALHLREPGDDLLPVRLVAGVDRDVAYERAAADLHQVYGADVPARFTDCGRDAPQHPWRVSYSPPQRQAVAGAGMARRLVGAGSLGRVRWSCGFRRPSAGFQGGTFAFHVVGFTKASR